MTAGAWGKLGGSRGGLVGGLVGGIPGLGGFGRMAAMAAMVGSSLALAGCLGYDGEIYHGYVIDDRTMSQVKVGSSAEQVLVVLGTPSTTSTVGGDAWYYISQKALRPVAFMKEKVTDQRVFAVYFDKNKKVERIANYGLEDGKLIDYVTRTTPTAGNEPSFVRNMLQNLLRFSDGPGSPVPGN